ncbi:amidohydrolase [Aliikangiella sp. G2MR2-5]|uniref:amidohydrolase n=1 Tax=Aliikangiella sp. G2MR2-5 TaxID=2788943 RepID=UPI001FEFBC52|nr:amidohydrolase family protein [Aliikangiella sp. G2MR2-5]
MKVSRLVLFALLSVSAGCQPEKPHEKVEVKRPEPVFVSTYKPLPSKSMLFKNATLLVGTGERIDKAFLFIKDGKVVEVGKSVAVSPDVEIVDVKGKWITPGIIDVHSHLGVYPSPSHKMAEDGNEMTAPNTAEVWAEHAVWTQDPGFNLARAGGVTSMLVLPGSANLFGGRGVALKNVPSVTMQGMKFPNAPHALKMACGENPKRVYGSDGRSPMTRMGNVAGYRKAWIEAVEYKKSWDDYYKKAEQGEEVEPPGRDLQLETLKGVLEGKIRIHNHCYRAEEMAVMIDIAKEFGYKISTFHHAIEAYKVADLLAENNICAAMWADWWGFKHEAFDTVTENVAMVDKASPNACAIVHSDSAIGIQHLNQEAAKAMAAGNRMGLQIKPKDAIRWLTLNSARSMGVDSLVGSLESGKMADFVIWNQNPFSVYAKAEKVFIDGALVFDRDDKSRQAASDFELGIEDPEGERL